MDIEIPCELYHRLEDINGLSEADPRKHLNSIYIERRDNVLFVIATDVKIAVIQKSISVGPDTSFAIRMDNALLLQCATEKQFNSNLILTNNPALNFVSAKTTFGYNFPGNIGVMLPDNNEFQSWREWLPDEMPTQSNGNMLMNAHSVARIAFASPSGSIIFPEFIDVRKPVLVRDVFSHDWIGLFFPAQKDKTPAYLGVPDWV